MPRPESFRSTRAQPDRAGRSIALQMCRAWHLTTAATLRSQSLPAGSQISSARCPPEASATVSPYVYPAEADFPFDLGFDRTRASVAIGTPDLRVYDALLEEAA